MTSLIIRVGLGLVGFITLVFIDWRIAVGVFLMLWGNNMDQSTRWQRRL